MVEIDQYLMAYVAFGLVLIRCSGLAVFAPFFGSEYFPVRARIGIVVFLGFLMYPAAVKTILMPEVLGGAELSVLALQELSVGLIIGFLSSFVFMAAQFGGHLIGSQIGFAMANIVDPLVDQEVSIIGFFKMNLMLLVFVILNLHLYVVLILYKSYEYVGIGHLAFMRVVAPLNEAGIMHMDSMFLVALKLATPILLIMLLNSTVVGFVTRTMPQMNIMVLGLPLRVALGLTALFFLIPTMCGSMAESVRNMVDELDRSAKSLGF